MGLQDLLITPAILVFLLVFFYVLRPYVTDHNTRRYFFPGLFAKYFGAIALGVIYQFYYGGGDTFNFYRDTSYIYNLLFEEPMDVFNLIFYETGPGSEMMKYRGSIYFIVDEHSFVVVRVAAFFALFTFNTYSATALLFATFSFLGTWMLFRVFYDIYPKVHKGAAISVFFIPSYFFWGSGLMKDSLTASGLCIMVYAFYFGIIKLRKLHINIPLFLLAAFLVYKVKIYLLLAMLPALILWASFSFKNRIKVKLFRQVFTPVLLVVSVFGSILGLQQVSSGSDRYSLEKAAETAAITANYLHRVSVSQNGSAYSLGELDGSLGSLIAVIPSAIWVSLFEPYLWKSRNPVMLLSALEASVLLIITLRLFVLYGIGSVFRKVSSEPVLIFCITFTLLLAFIVGATSYNYGTLVRYKIPFLPFFGFMLVYIDGKCKEVVSLKKLQQKQIADEKAKFDWI